MNLFWSIVLAIVVGWFFIGFLSAMCDRNNRVIVGGAITGLLEIGLFVAGLWWLCSQFVR